MSLKYIALSLLLCTAALPAQNTGREPGSMPGMPSATQEHAPTMHEFGMQQMPGMAVPHTFIGEILHHGSSGTSAEPTSTATPMLMSQGRFAALGSWMLMLHANVFIVDTQQSSARGGDKFFSTNWFMPMAQRRLGRGQLTLRAMFSLEPATVTGERYPLLFQQGETAYGKPISDGQHPHDFFMELAALYDRELGERTLLSFYLAPQGDPAIGPTAYPHRASASEDPVGTLGHHQQDSTHIANDVATVGLTHGIARVEVSGFHGREPDEHRWNIDQGALDSWATRLTVQPGQNWSGQISYARLHSPEALFPREDQARTTASVMYNRPLRRGEWASTLLWGRTRSLADNSKENSYLAESRLRFADRNALWTRIEDAGRSSELLNGERPLPAGFREEPVGHVAAFSLGYDREWNYVPHLASAIGAQATAYRAPDALRPVYGSDPFGFVIFLRLRVRPGGGM